MLDATRFWLQRGVDGFRLDTINFYFHDKELRDNPALAPERRNASTAPAVNPYNFQEHIYDKNRPENLAFLKRFRALLDEFPAIAAVGEVGDSQRGLEIVGEYTSGDDKMQMCYAFEFLAPDPLTPARVAEVQQAFAEAAPEGWACWAFSNHDVVRHVSRWGADVVDRDAFAKMLCAILMTQRGSVCIYQGEELGLTEADIAFEDLQDPYGIQFWPEFKGRDGCRTPMVWDSKTAQAGFSTLAEDLAADPGGTRSEGGGHAAGRRDERARALSPLPRFPPAASGLCQGRHRLPSGRGQCAVLYPHARQRDAAVPVQHERRTGACRPAGWPVEYARRPWLYERDQERRGGTAGLGRSFRAPRLIGRNEMTGLVLKDIRKTYGQVKVLHGIDLTIEVGEFIVFVGPSGCGKSTLLRMIAGLEDITSGEMIIDGQVVNNVPPSKRGIAMVFQSYALYPHMTVYDNMAFGMRIAGESKDEIDRRVKNAADILQLTPYLDRLPKALSGGQRQRVAIGRAICRDPKVFLFDEPLSNLDAALRVATRIEIAKLNEIHARHDDDLCHPRPGRGHDSGRPHRRAFGRQDRAGRSAARTLRAPGQSLRRPLHRLAGDEHHADHHC